MRKTETLFLPQIYILKRSIPYSKCRRTFSLWRESGWQNNTRMSMLPVWEFIRKKQIISRRTIYVLAQLAKHPKVVAIGEIGLDYHYENANTAVQHEIFRQQLDLADQLDLPVIIHSRDATQDTINVLKSRRNHCGVLHCFSGSADTAQIYLKMGYYIGFTGVVTFSNAKKAVEAARTIPLNRILLETDCPYMAPVPFRGKNVASSDI